MQQTKGEAAVPEPASMPLQEKWEDFLVQYGYDNMVKDIATKYPEERSLYVKFEDLERFDMEMADGLLESPYRMLKAGEAAIASIAEMALTLEEGAKIHLRFRNLPQNLRIGIRDIRSKHMSRFISVEGLVRKASEVRPKVSRAAFKCMRCGYITYLLQDELALKEPLECYKTEEGGGGCGRAASSTKFILLKEQSNFIDTEKIEIQEEPEALRAGAQPQSLTAYVEDDIAGKIFPGARVVITGVLDSRPRTRDRQGQTTFDIFMRVNNIEFIEADAYEMEVTEEELTQIRELAKNPNVIELIRDSISPTIYGLPMEKEALALQLFGGVPKHMPDGTRIRGDIHLMVIGDPGTAKSQLLRYMADITPRGIYASGKSSTGAGLTAAAVKDEWSEGRWTLEAGALVLADMGLACIDELDKMSPQDRSSMHEAMEQQTISVAKAGITATLRSRCAILGAANPKWGRFQLESEDTIADQIDLPPTLLSRFDLIFPISDKPDSEEDSKTADHILMSHLVGEMRERHGKSDEEDTDPETRARFEEMSQAMKPIIPPDLLRKYVFVAKKGMSPLMTDEAMDALKSYYLEVRKIGEREEAHAVPITARQLEAFVRVAEASARARMSDKVSKDDAERAIRIVKEYLRRVIGKGRDELSWDSDSLYTEVPATQQQRIIAVRRIMRELYAEDSYGFTMGEVIRRALDLEIEDEQVRSIWEKMRKDGDIYQQSGKRDGEYLWKLTHAL
jgi:replicative DNA helicase Mcm